MFPFSKLAMLFLNRQFQTNQKNATCKFVMLKNIYTKYCSSSVASSSILPDKNVNSAEENRPENENSIEIKENSLDASRNHSLERPAFTREQRNPFHNIEQDTSNKDPDVSHFIDDIAPPLPVSFNLAAYANRSPTLQKLVELKVDLSAIEQNPEYAKYIIQLDFETDIKPYIQFLHDNGIPADDLGDFLSKNPLIFKHSLENLQIRINYLQSKKFSPSAIARIISNNPSVLSMDTKSVDRRLGFLQKTFDLTGDEVRYVAAKGPKLISYNHVKFLQKLFMIKEEFGFSQSEMKQLLLLSPKIWILGRTCLTERFSVVHRQMGISHEQMLTCPQLFLKRGYQLEQRHKYLEKLGRAQYDPTKPGYICLHDIATTTDDVFCTKCTKTSVREYNDFLKTL